ncbi:MAG: MFS transporter [Candidatus Limnocylindrales bacterium]
MRLTLPSLLRQSPFRNFWLGQTISVMGDQVTSLALPIVAVLVLKADPAQMGLLTAASLLPHLFFSLPAGVWLDRVHRRRRLMIVVDFLRAALIATVPLAFLGGWLSMTHLFLLAFAVGTLSVAFDISWSTLFVAVAKRDEFVQANSLLNGSRSLSGVAGPSIGGALIHFLGAPIAMVVDAFSFIASAFFLTRVKAVEPPVEHQPGSLRSQLASGLSFILRDEIMRPTVLSAATLNLFNFGFQALFILYVTTYLGVDPGLLGLALGAGAIGAVVGALTASRIGRRVGLGPAFVLGLIIFPAALILVPLAGGPMPVILAALFTMEFVGGFGVMILDINAGAIIPARTPDRIRSRVTGAFRFINMGIRPIGALLGGYLGTVIGVRETLFVVTIASLLGVLWLVGTPVWRLHDMPEVAQID